MSKSFKIACLNLFAAMFCFLVHSGDVQNNAGTLIICMAIAMISFIFITIAFIFKPHKVKPLIRTEA